MLFTHYILDELPHLIHFLLFQSVAESKRVTQKDPGWRAGGTTLQGHSDQQFIVAESIKVDPSKKVVLTLRLVAR